LGEERGTTKLPVVLRLAITVPSGAMISDRIEELADADVLFSIIVSMRTVAEFSFTSGVVT
jgi:hypothetical protein